MIKSMTGYGRSRYEVDGRVYVVEIKSVNHKYNDISIRLPRILNYKEDAIKKQIINAISRGKIDVFITFENYSDKGINVKFNMELAKIYVQELNRLSEETGVENNITAIDISKMPEIFKLDENQDEDLIGKELEIAIAEALEKFIEMRSVEGEKLVQDMEQRINIIEQKIQEISNFSEGLVEDYIVKLTARVKELMKTDIVDETRIAQEIVMYSDKCSIQEELTRLESHINQFRNLIKQSSPIGKKIDFLIQEMNRETNTIGSKANCLEITNRVIEVKTEIENIREQVQNIE
ncbi:MAG: YicC family protein [Clostridia bacterium]|nr:YicC family protein [Clostridia bacterium]